MRLRILAGSALTLAATTCAGWPSGHIDPQATSCAGMLAETAAYLHQHVDAREEKLKVIRFASQADMDAYNSKTAGYDTARIDFITMGNVIEGKYDLPDAPGDPAFDHTTDEEADVRITEGRACAAPLLE